MRQPSRYIAIALVAFGISGCNFFRSLLPGGEPPLLPDVATEPVTPETLENPPEIPIQNNQQPVDPSTPPSDGEDGVVADGEEGPEGILPLDLIPYTDPDSRASQVAAERPDPFQLLPTAPVVNIPVEEQPSQLQRPGQPQQPQPPGELAEIPELVPIAPPSAPPPPNPELARAIAVTGVVQLGNIPYAIVDAPNEPHGRYVRAGQLLSNGEVLVRRIDMNPGGDPVVVFEQFGIEVPTAVGSGGAPSDNETAAAAIAAATIR